MNHNNDDFMNYVGYQLYGGGTDPNFQPMQTSNSPHLNINPKTAAFVILMFAIGWVGDTLGNAGLYLGLFGSFFISLLAGLAFFLYVPWSMKNERVVLHNLRTATAIFIISYIILYLVFNRHIFYNPNRIINIAGSVYPLVYTLFIAITLIQKKPKQLTIWLALLAGNRMTLGILHFLWNYTYYSTLQYVQFFSMLILWIVLFAACTHPGWKKAGIIVCIIVVFSNAHGLTATTYIPSIVLRCVDAAWMIMLAFTMANSTVLVENKP